MMSRGRYFLVIMMLLLAGFFPRFQTPRNIELKNRVLNLKERVDGWRFDQDIEMKQDAYTALDPDSLIFRQYLTNERQPLTLVVVYHQDDRWGAHNPIVCYKSSGWEVIEEDHVVKIGVNDRGFSVNRFLIKKDDVIEIVYYYWFTSNRTITASRAKQMLHMVWNKLIHGFSESGFVRISMPITRLTEKEIISQINEFTDNFTQILEKSL